MTKFWIFIASCPSVLHLARERISLLIFDSGRKTGKLEI
jgi:hypothetical protein